MKYFSICSGIGADKLAFSDLGWECKGFSEIADFPRAILSHYWKDVPLHGDFTKIEDVPTVDLVCGGTPCQAFSVAGQRGGLADSRGELSLEFGRFAQRANARWLLWENVPGVLSSAGGRDFGLFLRSLADAGYSVAWRVLDTQWFGLPQRRKRLFVVGYRSTNGAIAGSVLFDPKSGDRHPEKGTTQGQDPAGTPSGGTETSGRRNDANGITFIANAVGTLCADTHPGSYSGQDAYTGRILAQPMPFDLVQITHPANYSKVQAGMPSPPVAAMSQLHVAMMVRTANTNANGHGVAHEQAHTLDGAQGQALFYRQMVRRLTPRECERLQGFPDDFTAIPYKGKAVAADSNRYKAIGNAWSVPVARWIAQRINRVDQLINA